MALASSSSEHGTLSGMMLAATAFALLTSVDTIFKLIALNNHPTHQIIFINACFALLPILIWTMVTGGLQQLRTVRLAQHLARGSTSVLSAFAAVYAYTRLPLTSFYAIVFMGPLLVTLMSVFWLGEKIDRARWFAIGSGLFGIMIVTHFFGLGETSPSVATAAGRFAALLSVFCYALSVIAIRRMRLGETNLTFSFYGYLASLLIGGSLCLLLGTADFSASDIAHLALSGTLGGISSICLMTAYHRTPVAYVAPFQYTQIIWGAIAGYLFWQHMPDVNLVVGATIVAASGFFVIYREMRAKEVR